VRRIEVFVFVINSVSVGRLRKYKTVEERTVKKDEILEHFV
jgi:hypothetical protein